MSKVDKQYFFDNYPRKLNDKRKANLSFIIDEFDESILLTRLSHLACCIGNMTVETNETFAPVVEGYYLLKEFNGRYNDAQRVNILYNYYAKNNSGALRSIFPNGKDGIAFYGRGDIQLTHDFNYRKFAPIIQKKYGLDLMKNPELACRPDIAFTIMEEGMTNPDRTFRDANFTGFTLEQFFNDKIFNWVSSRKIINGLDRAHEIAQYSQAVYKALRFEDEIGNEQPLSEVSADPERAKAEASKSYDVLNGYADNDTSNLT